MGRTFAVLDEVDTPMGTLSLRRRLEPTRQVDVYEVKLGDEFLMSSLFVTGEQELARLGLAAVPGDGPVDVVVGGLGLGYTAEQALRDPRVASLTVVEALAPVIDWHRQGLLPEVGRLGDDPRVRFVEADFFAATAAGGYDPDDPSRRFDAVLLDVDHTPEHHLAGSHAGFYTAAGISQLVGRLTDGGVFALWSDRVVGSPFLDVAREVLSDVVSHEVTFRNVLTGGTSANGVLVGRRPRRSSEGRIGGER